MTELDPPRTLPTSPTDDRSARRSGRRAALAMASAVVPLGVALGVALGESSVHGVVAWLTAPLLFAGSAQLVLVGQLDVGAPTLVAVAASVLVSARFAIYGTAIGADIDGPDRPGRWLRAHLVVDQTYAIITSHGAPMTRTDRQAHYLHAAVVLFGLWTSSVGVGVLLGPRLPDGLPLEVVPTAMFLALVVPGISRRSEWLTLVVAGGFGAVAGLGSATVAAAAVFGAIAARTAAAMEPA